MTKPTPAQLKTEFTTDPQKVGYATAWADGDDETLVALVNDKSKGTPMLQAVPMLAFAKFAAGSGIRQKLKNAQSNPTVGAVCDTAIEMFGQLTIAFDPTDSSTQAMMSALVQAGVIAASDVTATNNFCTLPASRYDNLSGDTAATATLRDVTDARKA